MSAEGQENQELTKSQRRRYAAKAKRAAENEEFVGEALGSLQLNKKGKDVPSPAVERSMKVCGPSMIQALRGHLLGREVALICCSEAHEDAVDLTRQGCITEQSDGWLENTTIRKGLDPAAAWKEKSGVTLEQAKAWAEQTLEDAEEDSEEDSEEGSSEEEVDKDGAVMVFVPTSGTKGSAYIFLAGAEHKSWRQWPTSTVSFEFGDMDEELREFCRRRRTGNDVPVEEHDKLLAKRKLARRAEGLELFDDWLSHQAEAGDVHLELVLEAPVLAHEVELHINESVGPAPPAHECLRQMELDSESDSDDEHGGGSDSYIDYLRRRAEVALPKGRIHHIDPRELGEGSETVALRESFQAMLKKPLPKDAEALELDSLRAKEAVTQETRSSADHPPALPSWEAFFGGAADLLYYHPEVKADFTPFLTKNVGSPDALRRFFDALYFGTVDEALAEVRLGAEVRPFSRVRSLAFRPEAGAPLLRRSRDRPRIPVKVAPLDCFLKAHSSNPPRTWVSGLAEKLRLSGAEEIVTAARAAYSFSVAQLLADPKDADKEGDYFEAWLRECHPAIFEDVDSSDPAELRKMDWAPSLKRPNSKKHKHNLKAIRIPNLEAAYEELLRFDPEVRLTSRRERVLAKILVDAFQLRLVDLASVLKIADVIMHAPETKPIVIVYFAGGDHSNPVAAFWRSQGFSAKGLPKKGVVGKEDFEDDEPRGLELPRCLQNLGELFPVPQ